MGDDHVYDREERHARLQANHAALTRLNEMSETADPEALDRLRAEYQDRIRQLEVCVPEEGDHTANLHTSDYHNLVREALVIERRAVIRLRNELVINDAVLRRIQKDLDFAEGRLMRGED